MPVYNTRDLIPFVNELESRINGMNVEVDEWRREKGRILTSLDTINSNKTRATTALVKADEALTELNTATYDIVAQRGQRLKKLIESLKQQMFIIAQEAGGGKAGYDERINAEIDNAVSSVDAMVEDGLKLDYRLRKIQELAMEGKTLSEKELFLPYVYEINQNLDQTNFTVPDIDGIQFVNGDVTVLTIDADIILDGAGSLITGVIDETGNIVLSAPPKQPIKCYFPVQMDLKDIPSDFLLIFMQMVVQKNSHYMQQIAKFQNTLNDILRDIQAMKGENWTVDFSIMRNHQDIIKESITPKGLQVEVKNGMAHATFSYNDHPHLSHFILEKWNEQTQQWEPFDGQYGIIYK
jgi:F0F1-type ATP synthase membrane subunit b/b'